MHILFFTPAYPPFPGGGERYVGALAQELVGQGHRVTAVTTSAQTEQDFWLGTPEQQIITELLAGVTVIRCPIRPFPGKQTGLIAWRKSMTLLSMLPGTKSGILRRMAGLIPPVAQLKQALAGLSVNYDLVHGFNISWENMLVIGWQYAKQAQIPFIVTPFTHLGTKNDRVFRNSTMDHQLQLMREADRVLTLTSIESAGLAQFGIPRAQLDVVGGGLEPLPLLPDTDSLLARLGVQRPYVICVGRASQEKGTIHAAQAVLALRQQGYPVSLVQVGQAAPEFERFVTRLVPEEQAGVRPLGILSESEKHGLIAEATALLLPSRTDSFGIVLLEAWAHGKPVIGANAGGIPGVIDQGQNGILVEFGDVAAIGKAVASLLANPEQREKMGQNGREKASAHYTWDKVGSRVLHNYNMTQIPQEK